MLLQFSLFFSSLLFLLGLELASFRSEWVLYVAGVLALFTAYTVQKFGQTLFAIVIPLLLTLSSTSLLYLIDSSTHRQWFIMIVFVFYYAILLGIYRLRYYAKDQTARAIIACGAMATMFLFYSCVYGLYLNFTVSMGVFMLTYCIGTILLSYQYFSFLRPSDDGKNWWYSIILGLALAEIAWVVTFWPFGYLTTGVIVLIFYYILWDLVQSHFLDILSKKRVFAHVVLFILLVSMVLTSTQWIPVV